MQQKHLISLGSRILKGPEPEVTSDVCQLLGQGDDRKMRHQLEGQVRILFRVVRQLEEPVGAHIELREEILVEIYTSLLKLNLRQVGQVVVCLTNKLLGCQEGVDQEAPAGDLPWDPLGAAIAGASRSVELLGRHALLLQAADAAPVADLEVLYAREEQLEGTACEVVRNQKIWVYHSQSVDEGIYHLSLLLEVLDILPMLDLLLKIKGHGLSIELP